MSRSIDDIREAFDLGYSVDRLDVRALLDEADRLANLCREYEERAEAAEAAQKSLTELVGILSDAINELAGDVPLLKAIVDGLRGGREGKVA